MSHRQPNSTNLLELVSRAYPLLTLLKYLSHKDLSLLAKTSTYGYAVLFFVLFYQQSTKAYAQQSRRLILALRSGNLALLQKSKYLGHIRAALISISQNPDCEPEHKVSCSRALSYLLYNSELSPINRQWSLYKTQFTHPYHKLMDPIVHAYSDATKALLVVTLSETQINSILFAITYMDFSAYIPRHPSQTVDPLQCKHDVFKRIIAWRLDDCEQSTLNRLARSLIGRICSRQLDPGNWRSRKPNTIKNISQTLQWLATLTPAITNAETLDLIHRTIAWGLNHSCLDIQVNVIAVAKKLPMENPNNQEMLNVAIETARRIISTRLVQTENITPDNLHPLLKLIAQYNPKTLIQFTHSICQMIGTTQWDINAKLWSLISMLFSLITQAKPINQAALILLEKIEERNFTEQTISNGSEDVVLNTSRDMTGFLQCFLNITNQDIKQRWILFLMSFLGKYPPSMFQHLPFSEIQSIINSDPDTLSQVAAFIQEKQKTHPSALIKLLATIPVSMLDQSLLITAANTYLEQCENRKIDYHIMAAYLSKINDQPTRKYCVNLMTTGLETLPASINTLATLARLPRNLLTQHNLLRMLNSVVIILAANDWYNSEKLVAIIPSIMLHINTSNQNSLSDQITSLLDQLINGGPIDQRSDIPPSWIPALVSMTPFMSSLNYWQFSSIHTRLFRINTTNAHLILTAYWSARYLQGLPPEAEAVITIQKIYRGYIIRKNIPNQQQEWERLNLNAREQIAALFTYLANAAHWTRNAEHPEHPLPQKTFVQLNKIIESTQHKERHISFRINCPTDLFPPPDRRQWNTQQIKTTLTASWGRSIGLLTGWLSCSAAMIAVAVTLPGSLIALAIYIAGGIIGIGCFITSGLSLYESIERTERSQRFLTFFKHNNFQHISSTQENMNRFTKENPNIDKRTKVLPAIRYPGMIPDLGTQPEPYKSYETILN